MKKVSSSAIFRDFYTENYIYVDKTEAIYNLLSNNKKIFIQKTIYMLIRLKPYIIFLVITKKSLSPALAVLVSLCF